MAIPMAAELNSRPHMKQGVFPLHYRLFRFGLQKEMFWQFRQTEHAHTHKHTYIHLKKHMTPHQVFTVTFPLVPALRFCSIHTFSLSSVLSLHDLSFTLNIDKLVSCLYHPSAPSYSPSLSLHNPSILCSSRRFHLL